MGRESMRKSCLLNCRLEKECFEWVVGDLVAEGNSSRDLSSFWREGLRLQGCLLECEILEKTRVWDALQVGLMGRT